ncbi:MAG: hypothetical protein A3I68_01455 [Candidatus Melainabacteria bacterium RIFCSPLOWO2_02_FULL_35_15]|nr:MAG: hypothetical protein A3F80_01325 [Candidatus Melainabacteria bacterium RIFCSPLOWO2_12_FULL_35_11]OGI12980.1 MAG: hypothetical protein A3I68_01455 [Candidatus Melainabacteria bacterium RIFCSPLOWO2_02_FULL_35_15]
MNNLLFFILLSFFLITILPALSIEDIKQVNEEKSLVPEDTNSKSEFNPKPASASLYNLGLKSYEQGDLKSAISFFKRAIDLDPEFVDAYYNLGAIFKKQKDFSLAINALQKAYNINPKDYEVAFELASCYFEEKNYQSAKQYFSLIPQNFPKYNEAKQKTDLINQSLITNRGSLVPQNPVNNQAQLLVDTLGKAEGSDTAVTNQAELLVNNLAKPSPENLSPPMKVITNNFNGPTGIAKDSKNNIYIGNFSGDRIERITSDGKREVFLEKNGIKGPVGLAIDGNDNLYVANYGGDSIIKITQNKEVSVISDKVVRPYYLLYDPFSNKLFVTVQGSDALIEIITRPDSKQPITAR